MRRLRPELELHKKQEGMLERVKSAGVTEVVMLSWSLADAPSQPNIANENTNIAIKISQSFFIKIRSLLRIRPDIILGGTISNLAAR